MAIKFKEITKKAEDLIERGRDADENVNSCQARVNAAATQVRTAQRALSDAMETDEEGNPQGDVQAAQTQLMMAQGQLAAGQRALTSAQEQVAQVRIEKDRHIQTIEQHNRVGQDNLRKVRSLGGNAFSSDVTPLATDIVERLNIAEEAKARLLRSMGIAAVAELLAVPDFGEGNSYAGQGGGFSVLNGTGTHISTQIAAQHEGAVSGWSGLGDWTNGNAGSLFDAQAGQVTNTASQGVDNKQGEQHKASREQYLQESNGYMQVMNSVVFDESLSLAEKKEALSALRENLLMLQERQLDNEKEISDSHSIVSAAKTIRSYADEWIGSLSRSEIAAINDYTGEMPPYYKNINSVLRKKATDFDQGNEERSKSIHSALQKAKLPSDIKVYRGISAEALNELNFSSDNELIGDFYLDRGFISTSLGRTSAFQKDVMLELSLPAGCPAASIEKISKAGGYEQEVLIDRGRLFKITGVRYEDGQRIISADYWGGVSDE